jgi:hypothetical protein
MKKLLIAAVAMAVAVAAQAATFSWKTDSKAYSIVATTLEGGLTAGTHYAAATTSNANTMYNQITSYTASWAYEITFTSGSNTDKISGSLSSDDFSSRAVQLDGLSSALIVQTDPVTPVDYSIVITGTIKDGKGATWELTSDAIVGTWNVPSLGDLALTTTGPAGFTAAPEPTSGLLLLLGVAGLALKRKRA